MFSFGFKRVWKNKANTKFDICSSSFKSVERNWASFKKKTFFKCFPFSDSNTVVVSSEMIDQKVIHKFIILLLNSAQRLILALGMWNSQELFRRFRLKTRSSNTDLRWRGANLLLVTCMCPLLAFKKKKKRTTCSWTGQNHFTYNIALFRCGMAKIPKQNMTFLFLF